MPHLQEKKIICLSLAAGIAFLLISGLLIFPNYQKIKEVNKQIFDLRSQLEIKYKSAKQIHKNQVKFSEIKKLVAQYENKFLKKNGELSLITLLENRAEKFNLAQDINLNPELLASKKELSMFELDIRLTGELQNIMRYLESLNKDSYFISLTDLNFTKGGPLKLKDQKKSGNPITLNLQTKVYVQE